MSAKTLQSCPTLCNPMEGSPPGSSVRGILQARILEWVVMPSSRGSSWPRDRTCVSHVSCIGRQVLYYWATWEAPWLLSLILHNIVTISWIGYIGAILTTYQYTVSLPLSTHCPLLLPCLRILPLQSSQGLESFPLGARTKCLSSLWAFRAAFSDNQASPFL